MRKLYAYFMELSEIEQYINKHEIIESATVPLIKLEINL